MAVQLRGHQASCKAPLICGHREGHAVLACHDWKMILNKRAGTRCAAEQLFVNLSWRCSSFQKLWKSSCCQANRSTLTALRGVQSNRSCS